MSDAVTKHDLEMAVADLKTTIVDLESNWLRWIVGFQLTYFAITIGAMFFIAEHIK